MKTARTFLFVTLDGGGNLPPVFGTARELKQRGHRIVVLTEPCLESVITSEGFEYYSFSEYFDRTDRSLDIFKDSVTPSGDMSSMKNVILGPSKITFNETLRAIDQLKPDVLVADVLLPASLMAAELREVPRALMFHLPEYLPGPNRPPGMLGLTPGKSLPGKWRDRLLGKLLTKKLNDYLPLFNEIRGQHGMSMLKNTIDVLHQADVRLIQTLRKFDFPIEPAPANVRYTGPVLDDPDWTSGWQNPWPNDDRPLVVVGLSSTFQSQSEVINRCIEALEKMSVRALITTGPAIDPAQFRSSDSVVVMRSAPHSLVFPKASLVITHAGHGTVMRSLANGLPMVCIPFGRDQKDNAAKIVFHGCGLKLNPKANADQIQKAVERILSVESYRSNARKWQHLLSGTSGSERAADELEQLNATVDVPAVADSLLNL